MKKMFGLMLSMLVGVALLVPLTGCPSETKKVDAKKEVTETKKEAAAEKEKKEK